MRRTVFFLLFFMLALELAAKGEYTGKYLYAKTDPNDSGAIVVKLPENAPKLERVIAFSRRSKEPYLGQVDARKREARFDNLPPGKYDLLLVAPTGFFEGLQPLPQADDKRKTPEGEAVSAEIEKVEAFFEGKTVHWVMIDANKKAVALVQQWRKGKALAESGAVLKSTIHSIDLFWFEKPLKAWQLLKRRQLYRDEFPLKSAFAHRTVPKLSNILVLRKPKVIELDKRELDME